jgi:hypothetical protein
MNREEVKELRKFKDEWAQEKGYENWYDYKDHCDSNGYDESEIGYDELMFAYGQHILSKQSGKIDDKDYDGGIMSMHFNNDY